MAEPDAGLLACGGKAASTPPVPVITSLTAAGPGSMVIRMSARTAAPAGAAAQRAPHSVTPCSRLERASPAMTSYPVAARFAHMGRPMLPTPIKPMQVTMAATAGYALALMLLSGSLGARGLAAASSSPSCCKALRPMALRTCGNQSCSSSLT
jgi:hypothetical protein